MLLFVLLLVGAGAVVATGSTTRVCETTSPGRPSLSVVRGYVIETATAKR
jgi:hypothetical protein